MTSVVEKLEYDIKESEGYHDNQERLPRTERVEDPGSSENFQARNYYSGENEENEQQDDSILVKTPCCTIKKTFSFTIKVILFLVILGVTSLLMYIFNTDHPVAQDVVMFVVRNAYAAPFILIGM